MRRRRSSGLITELPPQVYVDRRPAESFAAYHEWARTRRPRWLHDLLRALMLPVCASLFRQRVQHVRRVPRHGGVILAPNHFSAMDHFFCGMFLPRRVRFMAKSQLFRGPLAWILRHAGAFPVRRGHRDEEAIATALSILAGGGALVIYPEGGRSRTDHVGVRARHGVGRLALESGAPVVPVAIHGSLRVREWKRLRFPAVTVSYGWPMRFAQLPSSTREQQQAAAEEVLAAIRQLYDEVSEAGKARAAQAPR